MHVIGRVISNASLRGREDRYLHVTDELTVDSIRCHGGRMEIIEWWPKLDSDAKAWLIAHNGEAVAPEVMSKIEAAGGAMTSSAWWVGESGPDGVFLSDEAVDWIETAANDEPD